MSIPTNLPATIDVNIISLFETHKGSSANKVFKEPSRAWPVSSFLDKGVPDCIGLQNVKLAVEAMH